MYYLLIYCAKVSVYYTHTDKAMRRIAKQLYFLSNIKKNSHFVIFY